MAEWLDYREWNTARFMVLCDVLGARWWAGKRVAVIGCGDATIARYITHCWAQVIVADAREKHVEDALVGGDGAQAGVVADFDKPWTMGFFDVIVHFGLLYHLADPEQSLRDVVTHAPIVLMETHLAPGDATVLFHEGEETRKHDQSFNGKASRFSAAWVEATLSKLNCGWARIVDERLNVRGYSYTGPRDNRSERGMWMIWGRAGQPK